jgi:ComF family protein
MSHFVKRNLLLPLIDFVYSPICFYCMQSVNSGEYLCTECESWLVRLEFESDQHRSLRNELSSISRRLRDIYALYDFVPGGVLQALIHNLKYQQKTNIGIDLGKQLGNAAAEFFSMDESWIILPVPLYPSKERERGYNQSYYISLGIKSVTGAQIDTKSVLRIRNTRSQTMLTTAERRENVSGAFILNRQSPSPENNPVAIIDDVITTGSTIAEIVSILPGKSDVYVFSIAHAPLQSK